MWREDCQFIHVHRFLPVPNRLFAALMEMSSVGMPFAFLAFHVAGLQRLVCAGFKNPR